MKKNNQTESNGYQIFGVKILQLAMGLFQLGCEDKGVTLLINLLTPANYEFENDPQYGCRHNLKSGGIPCDICFRAHLIVNFCCQYGHGVLKEEYPYYAKMKKIHPDLSMKFKTTKDEQRTLFRRGTKRTLKPHEILSIIFDRLKINCDYKIDKQQMDFLIEIYCYYHYVCQRNSDEIIAVFEIFKDAVTKNKRTLKDEDSDRILELREEIMLLQVEMDTKFIKDMENLNNRLLNRVETKQKKLNSIQNKELAQKVEKKSNPVRRICSNFFRTLFDLTMVVPRLIVSPITNLLYQAKEVPLQDDSAITETSDSDEADHTEKTKKPKKQAKKVVNHIKPKVKVSRTTFSISAKKMQAVSLVLDSGEDDSMPIESKEDEHEVSLTQETDSDSENDVFYDAFEETKPDAPIEEKPIFPLSVESKEISKQEIQDVKLEQKKSVKDNIYLVTAFKEKGIDVGCLKCEASLPDVILQFGRSLEKNSADLVYFVGGLPKKSQLKQELFRIDGEEKIYDIDIVTNATKEQILKSYPEAKEKSHPKVQGKIFVIEVKSHNARFQIQILQSDAFKKAEEQNENPLLLDSKTRDKTDSALYVDTLNRVYVAEPKVIATFNTNVVGMIAEPAESFSYHPLRMLRFINTDDSMMLEKETLNEVKRLANLLIYQGVDSKQARSDDEIKEINQYLNKMFKSHDVMSVFDKLHLFGLGEVLFPGLNALFQNQTYKNIFTNYLAVIEKKSNSFLPCVYVSFIMFSHFFEFANLSEETLNKKDSFCDFIKSKGWIEDNPLFREAFSNKNIYSLFYSSVVLLKKAQESVAATQQQAQASQMGLFAGNQMQFSVGSPVQSVLPARI